MTTLEVNGLLDEMYSMDQILADIYTNLGTVALDSTLTGQEQAHKIDNKNIAEHLSLAIGHIQTILFTNDITPGSLLKTSFEKPFVDHDSQKYGTVIKLPVIQERARDIAPFSNAKRNVTDKTLRGKFHYDAVEPTTAKEKITEVPPESLALFEFVLNGGDFPTNLLRKDVIASQQKIAGTKELDDPAVLERFQIVNAYLAGKAFEPEVLVQAKKGYSRAGKLVIGGFEDPRALCLGSDNSIFFTARGESVKPAKAICQDCAASKDCLDYAMENVEKFGIWGGKSERERRKLRAAIRLAEKKNSQS